MDGLTKYRVFLLVEKGAEFSEVFECWAEDYEHAEEQALNAYPDAAIIHVGIGGGDTLTP